MINPERVIAVLLADGWHVVPTPGDVSTFKIETYEYGEPMSHVGGFTFDEGNGLTVSGPLVSVLAVRHKR